MEQARLFIAIGVSFAIFFLWSMFFAPTPPETPKEAAQEQTPIKDTAKEAPKSEPVTTATAEDTPATLVRESTQPARRITVDTPLFRMVLSEKGGAVISTVLKEFREALDPQSPLKEMIDQNVAGGSVLTSMTGLEGLEQAVYTATPAVANVEIANGPGKVRFQFKAPNGIVVEKIFAFTPDSYLVDLSVKVHNAGDSAYQGKLGLSLQNTIPDNARAIGFEGPSALIANKLQQIKIKKIEEQGDIEGPIQWIAIEGRYFMTSIIPAGSENGTMHLALKDKIIKNQVNISTGEITPDHSKLYDFKIFMGPKSLSLLKSYNNKLDKAINFGWFDFLAKPCLWFMNFIYRFIPNYGIAIIILTIVSRALFWPLATKSYKSMGGMRKIQPLMQEIREKYKDDKTRMNQEMMALYKTYKINPMGGCLPMLIQMPVFFALYRMLYQAVELRHAPFMGWINDLSAPDRLFEFSFKIPFMDPPYGIPVLTIVMGASMLLQQKMTPTPGDPAQAKMMMLMPVIFTFIFINFSSGLVLYWLVSNIFSMAQQYYTQKQTS